jgi:hypothetical protein
VEPHSSCEIGVVLWEATGVEVIIEHIFEEVEFIPNDESGDMNQGAEFTCWKGQDC